jgi:hypothetical protein
MFLILICCVLESFLADFRKNINWLPVLTACPLMDDSGAKNVEKHLGHHEGPRNYASSYTFDLKLNKEFWVESQNIFSSFIYWLYLRMTYRQMENEENNDSMLFTISCSLIFPRFILLIVPLNEEHFFDDIE